MTTRDYANAQKQINAITLQDIRTWLASLPVDRTFLQECADGCLLAQYLQDTGIGQPVPNKNYNIAVRSVVVIYWYWPFWMRAGGEDCSESISYSLPVHLQELIERFDELGQLDKFGHKDALRLARDEVLHLVDELIAEQENN